MRLPSHLLLSQTYRVFGMGSYGIILPYSFIGSLFSDTIAIYSVLNSGGWYDFGFVLGVGVSAGSTASFS